VSTRPSPTARVFITGSADGLGRAAAQTLLEQGHEVVVHARNRDRLTAVCELLDRGAAAVVGDLSDPEETRDAMGSSSDSKLFVTTLAAAVARMCTDVFSNAVDPGWVPTKMGGAGAPDDLRLGHLTQVWLATSDDPQARTSGGYWHHQRRAEPAPSVYDERFQDQLLEELAGFTATRLVGPGRAEARAIA
jgi:NAD(P)-dependent dehydrogenase (short-subunit alcohol dehydrogenase family)